MAGLDPAIHPRSAQTPEPPAPRRVLLTADAVGGVWRYSTELAAGFVARGAEVLLAAMGPAPTPAQRAEAAFDGCTLRITGLPLDWLAASADQLTAAAGQLADLAALWQADTIHLHTPALAAIAGWPVPVVAVAHSCVGTWWRAVRGGTLPPDLAWRAELVAAGLAAAEAVIAPSHSFARALHETYAPGRPIHVVRNGRHPIPLRREPHPHALTAGRLWDAGKNIATLDTAAGEAGTLVRAAGPTHGPDGASVDCRHLRLLGPLGQAGLAREYARAAVFVSPARYEPFGLAVLEAAQAGCPLLLADIPTFRELWDGVAFFVRPDDTARLAAALRTMLNAPEVCEPLGLAARERAACYGPAAMIDATWAVHRQVVAAATAA